MKKILHFLLFILVSSIAQAQITSVYNTCGDNKVENSNFEGGTDDSPTVAYWTFVPGGNEDGWKQDNVLIYGEYIFIDRPDTYIAKGILKQPLCTGGAKEVKFKYNAGNVGKFNFAVKLGTQTIATFTENSWYAQSKMTVPVGIESKVYRTILGARDIDKVGEDRVLSNNIWHEVTLYVKNYTGGAVTTIDFEYAREESGISRQVRIDNVEIKDVLPKPIPTGLLGNIADCNNPTFNLTTFNPSATASNYTYEWHSVGANPSSATKVADATKVGVGTYFLYAVTSNCVATNCYSPASNPVVVTSNCCGSKNVVTNGDFSNGFTGWDKVEGSYNNVTVNNSIDGFTIVNSKPNVHNVNKINFPSGSSSIIHYYKATYNRGIQQNIELCKKEKVIVEFDFAVSEFGATNYTSVLLDNNLYLQIYASTWPHENKIWFEKIPSSGVTVTAKNLTTGASINVQNGSISSNNISDGQKHFYRIKIVIDEYSGTTGSVPLRFFFQAYHDWFLDNVVVNVGPPKAEDPKKPSANTTCPTGTYNLTTAQPTKENAPNRKFVWYESDGTTLVKDPTSVKPGVYKMLTKSTCSGCESATKTTFTVNKSCPVVSGKVHEDYDGSANGITNIVRGTNGGGLYALLVNGSGTVLNSVAVNTDGTYNINGKAGSGFYVMLHNVDMPRDKEGNIKKNIPAPQTSKLTSSFVSTGEGIGANSSGTVDGKSPTFNLSSADQPNVNFGIQMQPIPSGGKTKDCNTNGAPYKYTLPTPPSTEPTNTGLVLHGIDDDPTFNNGEGQKVIIKTLTQTGGVLKYGTTDITTSNVPYTIPSYDKTLLAFTPNNATDEAKVEFAYVFVDAAGTESAEAAKVSLTIGAKLDATVSPATTTTICKGGTAPAVTFTGVNGVAPYTFTYTKNGGAEQTITSSSGDVATLPAVDVSTVGTTTYEVKAIKDKYGCKQSSLTGKTVTVTVQEQPTATLSGAGSVCKGKSKDLTIALTGTAPWTVVYSDGTTNTNLTINDTEVTSGNYTLPVSPAATTTYSLVSVKDAGCAGTISGGNQVVTVNELPTISSITSNPANYTICEGSGISFTVNGTDMNSVKVYKNADTTPLTGTVTINTAKTEASYSYTATDLVNGDKLKFVASTTNGCEVEETITMVVNAKVTLTYNANGGSGTMSNKQECKGVSFNLATNAFTRTGYTFAGWSTTTTGAVSYNDGTSFTMPNVNTTLYAKWTINQYTLSFNVDGGSAVASQTLDYNTTGTSPTAPTKAGYTFGGWYQEAGLTTVFDFTTPITSDTILLMRSGQLISTPFRSM